MQAPYPITDAKDGNNRPYCVSLDWLSISGRDTGFIIYNREQQPSGYRLVSLGHGSKVFKSLYEVYDPAGVLVAELHAHPYQTAMDPKCIILKAANSLLYQADGVEQFFACVTALAIYYKGINRIDIACDQNEFYGGLLPQSLLRNYFGRTYLKLGINHGINWFDLGYYGTKGANGLVEWSKKPIVDVKARQAEAQAICDKNKELQAVGLPLLDPTPARALSAKTDDHYTSVTWGSRSAPVQVQLYNKTKELQEKTLKHYIVDAWKAAGLDVSRDVWRVEIRIMGKGKGLLNPETGKQFAINLVDVVLQQQVEEFFFAYASKHFQFFRDRGKVKLRQNEPVRLWGVRSPVLKPKQLASVKNPNRFTLVVANALAREEAALRRQAEREKEAGLTQPSQDGKSLPVYACTEAQAKAVQKVSEYFRDAYHIARWCEDQQLATKYEHEDFLRPVPLSYRNNRAWTFGSIAQEVAAKVSKWKNRRRERVSYVTQSELQYWASMEVDQGRVFEVSNYERAVDLSLRTLTYCEYVPKEEFPFPASADSELKDIDWDNF